jgi:Glyoxalase-like domain
MTPWNRTAEAVLPVAQRVRDRNARIAEPIGHANDDQLQRRSGRLPGGKAAYPRMTSHLDLIGARILFTAGGSGDGCAAGGGQETRSGEQRLEALGATLVRVICEDGVDHYGVVMRDPEDNEFDIN